MTESGGEPAEADPRDCSSWRRGRRGSAGEESTSQQHGWYQIDHGDHGDHCDHGDHGDRGDHGDHGDHGEHGDGQNGDEVESHFFLSSACVSWEEARVPRVELIKISAPPPSPSS